MGRWGYGGKIESDGLKKIETSFLKKHGYFCGWKSGTITWTNNWSENKNSVGIVVSIMNGDNHIRIHYTQTDYDTNEEKNFDYEIPLTTTPCRFGGKRYWFICPWYKNGRYCGKRVGTLYKDGDYFACRHCYDLTYSSRKQNRRYKFFSLFSIIDVEEKIEKLQKRIKTPYYRGKPTKKQRRLERFCRTIYGAYEKSRFLL